MKFVFVGYEEPPDLMHTIQYVEPIGIHTDLYTGFVVDPKHPRCYYCGRFIKVNWDRSFTGPCTICYEDTRWL